MHAGAAHADNYEYGCCISLWNYALHLKMEKETLLSYDTAFTARAIVQLYVNIMFRYINNPNPFDNGPPQFDDILKTAHYISSGIDTALQLLKLQPTCQSQLDIFDIVLNTWIHLIHILLQLAETEAQLSQIFMQVMPMLQKEVRTHRAGDSLLHLAVSSSSTLHSNSFLDGDGSSRPHNVFPSFEVTDFILKCGYDVHVQNNLNETPLHIAVKAENFMTDVTKVLLDKGAHLDVPDLRDITPLDILKAHNQTKVQIMPYISLKCLAAQVIMRERVPYGPEDVPEDLRHMLEMHAPHLPAISALALKELYDMEA